MNEQLSPEFIASMDKEREKTQAAANKEAKIETQAQQRQLSAPGTVKSSDLRRFRTNALDEARKLDKYDTKRKAMDSASAQLDSVAEQTGAHIPERTRMDVQEGARKKVEAASHDALRRAGKLQSMLDDRKPVKGMDVMHEQALEMDKARDEELRKAKEEADAEAKRQKEKGVAGWFRKKFGGEK
ncbi:MAG: hypothetical protein ABIH21_04990 [Patescibacteria group bacterium]